MKCLYFSVNQAQQEEMGHVIQAQSVLLKGNINQERVIMTMFE